MKNKTLMETKLLRVSLEFRWPAAAIGFYGGMDVPRSFIVLCAPLVIQIGRRSHDA